jgi:chemosensory pili system protein ChpA (sensor histidine kinase/response regulator)
MSTVEPRKPLILVVEDDETIRHLLEVMMEMQNYEVIAARDGLEGLLKLEFRHPSVVILDVMMPNVDGKRVLEEMRGDVRLRNVPVIVVTGKAEAHAMFDGMVGAANVMMKPFDPEALAHRVAELLADEPPKGWG